MTKAELNQIARDNPDCYIAKLIHGKQTSALLIPKKHAGEPIYSMPGMTPEMLHGATITIRGKHHDVSTAAASAARSDQD